MYGRYQDKCQLMLRCFLIFCFYNFSDYLCYTFSGISHALSLFSFIFMMLTFFFFYHFVYLFIYFLVVLGLCCCVGFLAIGSGGYSHLILAKRPRSDWGYSVVAMHSLLIVVASLVAECWL